MQNNHPGKYRSFFWPMILIGVGLVWLLGNLGLIPAFEPLWLLRLWPLMLIAIGIDLLFARRSQVVGAILGVLVIGVVIAFLVMGPALNLPQSAPVEQRSLTVPLEGIRSATVQLDLSVYPTNIHPLGDSNQLFDAQIGYQGTLDFSSSSANGAAEISLNHSGFSGWWFLPSASSEPLRWQIGLSPSVPMALTLRLGSGSADIDLSGLQLNRLEVNGASGSASMTLPASDRAYEFRYDGGSGSLDVHLPANTDLTVTLDGSSGSQSISVPAGAAVHLDVRDNGSGSVSAGGGITRLSGKSNEDLGVWETPGFSQASHRITIIVEHVGSGSVSVN